MQILPPYPADFPFPHIQFLHFQPLSLLALLQYYLSHLLASAQLLLLQQLYLLIFYSSNMLLTVLNILVDAFHLKDILLYSLYNSRYSCSSCHLLQCNSSHIFFLHILSIFFQSLSLYISGIYIPINATVS